MNEPDDPDPDDAIEESEVSSGVVRLRSMSPEDRSAMLAALAKSRPRVYSKIVERLGGDAMASMPDADTLMFDPMSEDPARRGHEPIALRPESGSSGLEAESSSSPGPSPVADGGSEDAPTSDRERFGKYVLAKEIGRGGIGRVYRGRDVDIGRDVAIKFLHEKYRDQPAVVSRFIDEVQIGGQLQHPGIVPVYDLEVENGVPFFTMKLIRGKTLRDLLAQRSSPAAERRRFVSLMLQICQTMAYAHTRGVVHRDLKPENVMIGSFGEVQVVDWGLGKVLGRVERRPESARTDSVIVTKRSRGDGTESVLGSVFGTPPYMPPEQAMGEVDRVDERSDVFSLGAMLCEVFTGHPPYVGGDHAELVTKAQKADLQSAHSALDESGAAPELVALAKECLSPYPSERPPNAGAIADRIGAWLSAADEQIRVAEVRAASAKVRARAAVLLSLAAFVIVALGGGGYLWVQSDAENRRLAAEQAVADALQQTSAKWGEARDAAIGDTALWSAALAAAEQAEVLARSDDVGDAIKSRARKQLATIQSDREAAAAAAERIQRDRDMLARLSAIRAPVAENLRAQGWGKTESRRLDIDYTRAFDTYLGATFAEMSIAEALAAMRRGDLAVHLAAALDHWAIRREWAEHDAAGVAFTSRLRAIAAGLDPDDDWRSRLRQLVPEAETERAALEALQIDRQTSVWNVLLLGEALWRAGAEERALAILRRGHEYHPEEFDLCFELAMSLERLRSPPWDEIEATLRAARSLRPKMTEVLHRLGKAREALGRTEDALRVYDDLVAIAPDDAHWHRHKGDCLSDLGRLEEAIQSLQLAREIEPRNVAVLNNLGSALHAVKRFDEAEAVFREAIGVDSRHLYCTRNLGIVLNDQKRYTESLKYLKRALVFDDRFAADHDRIGSVFLSAGEVEDAIAAFQGAVRRDPRRDTYHYNLGVALARAGRQKEALSSFEEANRLRPKDAATLYRLGSTQLNLGDSKAAERWLEQSAEVQEHAGTLALLGSARMRHGDYVDAAVALEKAVALDSQNGVSHLNLGICMIKQDRLERALESYGRAFALIPNSPNLNMSFGAALVHAGKLTAGLEKLERAREIWSKDPSADKKWLASTVELITTTKQKIADKRSRK